MHRRALGCSPRHRCCCVRAWQVIGNWAAFCAKEPKKDFPWNVEQRDLLAEGEHVARTLLQVLNHWAGLRCFLVFVLLSLALVNGSVQRMAWEGQREVSMGLSPAQALSALCAHSPLLRPRLRPSSAGVFVSTTRVGLKGFLMNAWEFIYSEVCLCTFELAPSWMVSAHCRWFP